MKEFDAAKHFDTHPALLGRTYNRLRKSQLKEMESQAILDDNTLAVSSKWDDYTCVYINLWCGFVTAYDN